MFYLCVIYVFICVFVSGKRVDSLKTLHVCLNLSAKSVVFSPLCIMYFFADFSLFS